MNNFNLIGELRDYAGDHSMKWLYGNNFFQNYEASKHEYGPGELILGADPFVATPQRRHNKIESIRYRGLIMLGRKYESDLDEHDPQITTTANLDETMDQKYDRRLYDLMQLLDYHITSFACENDLNIIDNQFEMSVNRLDENIDFVVCSITLEQ